MDVKPTKPATIIAAQREISFALEQGKITKETSDHLNELLDSRQFMTAIELLPAIGSAMTAAYSHVGSSLLK